MLHDIQTRLPLLATLLIIGIMMLIGLNITGYRAIMRSMSLRLMEEHNVTLAAAVARELAADFTALARSGNFTGSGRDDIANTVVFTNEHRLRALLQDGNVQYFDIHDLSGEVLYTSHPNRIGSNHVDDRDFAAATAGSVTNHLEHAPLDPTQSSQPQTQLVTFAPIYASHDRTPLGVLGLYGIAEPGIRTHTSIQLLIAAAFALPSAALLLLLGPYVRRRLTRRSAGPHASDARDDDTGRCHIITAQETERKRISRDLHDGIGQYLNAIKLHLQHITSDQAGRLPPDTRHEIEDVVQVVASATEEVRRISLALRPAMLDDLGLLATLNWLCREFVTAHPDVLLEKCVNVREEDIPEQLKTTVFRIAQEALTNVAKHSRAISVLVTLEKAYAGIMPVLRLTIVDDGVGFDPATARSHPGGQGGLGMHSMRERTELEGGTLEVRSTLNCGTCIQASWPLRDLPDSPLCLQRR